MAGGKKSGAEKSGFEFSAGRRTAASDRPPMNEHSREEWTKDDWESVSDFRSRISRVERCGGTEVSETHGCTDSREVQRHGVERRSALVRFVREEWNSVELFHGAQEDRKVVD